MGFLTPQTSVFDGYNNVDYSDIHIEVNEIEQTFIQDLGIFKPVFSEQPIIGLSEITYGYSAVDTVDPLSDEYHSTTIPMGVDIELSLAYTALLDSFGKPDLMKMVRRDSQLAAMTTNNINSKIDTLVVQYLQAHNMTLNSTLEKAYSTALFGLIAEDGDKKQIDMQTEMGKTVSTVDVALEVATTDVYTQLDQVHAIIRKNLKQRVRGLSHIVGICSPSYFRQLKNHANVTKYMLQAGTPPAFEVSFQGKYQTWWCNNILFVCAPDELADQIGNSEGCLYVPILNDHARKEMYPDFYTVSQRVMEDGIQGQDDLNNRYCTYTAINDLKTKCSVISDTSFLPIIRDPSTLVRSNWS